MSYDVKCISICFSVVKVRWCVAGEQVLRVLWYCMSYGNSCANPIIYNYASTDFRAGFRRAVYRLMVCLPKQPGGDAVFTEVEGTRNRVVGTNMLTTVHLSPRPPTAAVSAVRL